MASRVMHLAIASQLEKELELENTNRFRVGQILPDAVISADKKEVNTHFENFITCENGQRKFYDFGEFYKMFKDRINEDNLYLGYYFHLIEDSLFRKFLYYDLNLISLRGNKEFINLLYQDYHMLNGYLAEKYNLKKALIVPEHFSKEEINSIYHFEINEFLTDTQEDLQEQIKGEEKHFTKVVADRYIMECTQICKDEYKALLKGKPEINPLDYTWGTK